MYINLKTYLLQARLLMNQNDLLSKASELGGMTIMQLAQHLQLRPPTDTLHTKGWLGQAVEIFLGAQAGCLPIPDFPDLNIELKTIPLNANGRVAESTYVTTLPLLNLLELSWEQSSCYKKLQTVLWIPVESSKNIPLLQRRIGQPHLWSPNGVQMNVLKEDWEMLTEMVLKGQVEKIDGSLGQFLHIRPKAANAKALTKSLDEHANVIQTCPRGFYLRTRLTNQILAST